MADVLIKGIEMPKHCIDCPCMVDKYGGDNCCLQSEEANEKITSWDDMKAGCPLVELPEHGDLVDREWLKGMAYSKVEDFGGAFLDRIDIAIAPVVIPSNKVRVRKRLAEPPKRVL